MTGNQRECKERLDSPTRRTRKTPFNASVNKRQRDKQNALVICTKPPMAGGDYKSQHALCPGHLACWEV